MDNNAFYKYVESRGQSGYASAIVVKQSSESKYSLLIASETVPSVFGTQNSFEFDLVNSTTVGKIKGKTTLDDKEVECLMHRDNVYRLNNLKDRTLDFMYVTPDFVGWKFVGTIAFRPNDASADVLKGTYTITPMSADENPIMDCRSLLQETVTITNTIPDSITLVGSTAQTVSVVCDISDFDITCAVKDGATGADSIKYTATPTDPTAGNSSGTISISAASGTVATDFAILYITVSKTGYASWTTTIMLSK